MILLFLYKKGGEGKFGNLLGIPRVKDRVKNSGAWNPYQVRCASGDSPFHLI